MRDVAIIGAGVTKFGELWNKSFRAIGIEAGVKAMGDANLSGSEIDGVFIGNMSAGQFIKQKHIDALIADYSGMATNNIPATRVEAGGASGGVAFRQAVMAVASGMHDVVLVGGAEKMTDMDDVSINSVLDATADAEWEAGMGVTFAGLHAMMAQRMIHDGVATREEIASFSVNSHFHGALNPNAQFRKAITLDTVLKSGPVASPLGMFDCAPISDGAASLVLCPLEDAKNRRPSRPPGRRTSRPTSPRRTSTWPRCTTPTQSLGSWPCRTSDSTRGARPERRCSTRSATSTPERSRSTRPEA